MRLLVIIAVKRDQFRGKNSFFGKSTHLCDYIWSYDYMATVLLKYACKILTGMKFSRLKKTAG